MSRRNVMTWDMSSPRMSRNVPKRWNTWRFALLRGNYCKMCRKGRRRVSVVTEGAGPPPNRRPCVWRVWPCWGSGGLLSRLRSRYSKYGANSRALFSRNYLGGGDVNPSIVWSILFWPCSRNYNRLRHHQHAEMLGLTYQPRWPSHWPRQRAGSRLELILVAPQFLAYREQKRQCQDGHGSDDRGEVSRAGLSKAAPVIYFLGALIYSAGFNVNKSFNKKLFLNNGMFQFFS
jgi:hypothetical protein